MNSHTKTRKSSPRKIGKSSPRTMRRKSSPTQIQSPHMSPRFNIKRDFSSKVFFNDEQLSLNSDLVDMKTILESNPTLTIYPNEQREQNYINVTRYIYHIIKNSKFLCKGLNDKYIRDAFNSTEAVLVIGSEYMNIYPNGNVFGFALLMFDQTNNSLYVDVLCSHVGIKGAGDVLITQIENIAKSLFMNHVKLNSVKTAVTFYERYGFRKIKKIDSLYEMIKYV
jgi:hypothetical protein